ncbi:hypothetical protein ACFYN3_39905 [Streptomyces lavendulae]|uniref:hypothetical protein n=1 Tax=Streptomyces lavendulae TaxID=1914 RepID=UPI0036BCBA16
MLGQQDFSKRTLARVSPRLGTAMAKVSGQAASARDGPVVAAGDGGPEPELGAALAVEVQQGGAVVISGDGDHRQVDVVAQRGEFLHEDVEALGVVGAAGCGDDRSSSTPS